MPPACGAELVRLATVRFRRSEAMALPIHRLIRGRHAAWLTLVCGLVLTAVLGWHLHREAVEMDRKRLIQRAAEIKTVLDARLERSEMLLQHLRDYLMLSGESRNPVFARWCYENGLTINCPWILGIAVATNRNEVDLRATQPKPPASWTAEDWQILSQLWTEHPVECHLTLRSDVTDGLQFLTDYDLRCSHSDRDKKKPSTSRTMLAGAILGSRLSMSHRQTVMLDTNGSPVVGTVFYVPIYRPGLAEYLAVKVPLPHHHYCARWLHLSAVIVAPVDFTRLVSKAEAAAADLGIELFSSTNQTAETWLDRDRPTPRADDPGFRTYLTHRQVWRMYSQDFSIFFHTTPLFEAQSPRRLAKVAMMAGTVLTLLASALVGVALRARNRQEVMTEQIREARDALAAAQQERNKISRDLHDGTIQSLYAIQLGLDHMVQEIEAEPGKARRELSAVRRELDAVIAEIRQFITAEAGADQNVAFSAVLQALVQRGRTGTTAQLVLNCDSGASERLTVDQAVHLANIAREALSNSLRHAKPQRVEIALRLKQEAVVLEISDDGAGFDPKVLGRSGVGLTSMTTRAQEMGGTLDIQSSPGKGTRVVVRVPALSPEPMGAEGPGDSTDE